MTTRLRTLLLALVATILLVLLVYLSDHLAYQESLARYVDQIEAGMTLEQARTMIPGMYVRAVEPVSPGNRRLSYCFQPKAPIARRIYCTDSQGGVTMADIYFDEDDVVVGWHFSGQGGKFPRKYTTRRAVKQHVTSAQVNGQDSDTPAPTPAVP